MNTAYNFTTNQVTAIALTPGMTQIYASASGVSSSSFHQPQYQNAQGTSPVLDFFETCPIQSITLEVGLPGSQQTGQTTFVASSSQNGSQTATAVLTDIMGNTSLPNTNNGIVLNKIPLTWSASQPGVVGVASAGCLQSCGLKTPLAAPVPSRPHARHQLAISDFRSSPHRSPRPRRSPPALSSFTHNFLNSSAASSSFPRRFTPKLPFQAW